MNAIVKKNYPADRLPGELREGIPAGALVEVTIIADASEEEASQDQRQRMLSDLFEEARRLHQAGDIKSVSVEEAVRRVRDLRNEWDT